MTYLHPDWHRSQPPSQPHGLQTEQRLTKLEVKGEDHSARITVLERTLYAVIVSLAGLAHEKLPRALEWFEAIARLKP